MGEFSDKVYAVVKQIPRGKVATYGQIARLIGMPRSARYVGYALRANPEPGVDAGAIPCHRVVFKDGRMASGFAFGGEEVQRSILRDEGVLFDAEGNADMAACQWNGFAASDLGSAEAPLGPPPDFDWSRELVEEE